LPLLVTNAQLLVFCARVLEGTAAKRPAHDDHNLIAASAALCFFEQTRNCHRIESRGGSRQMRDPVLAGILSFVIPGIGQLYNGRILAGILWLIITPGFWIGTGGLLGWVCHVIAAYTAYSYAKDHPVRV
jgi:hypothetical protein